MGGCGSCQARRVGGDFLDRSGNDRDAALLLSLSRRLRSIDLREGLSGLCLTSGSDQPLLPDTPPATTRRRGSQPGRRCRGRSGPRQRCRPDAGCRRHAQFRRRVGRLDLAREHREQRAFAALVGGVLAGSEADVCRNSREPLAVRPIQARKQGDLRDLLGRDHRPTLPHSPSASQAALLTSPYVKVGGAVLHHERQLARSVTSCRYLHRRTPARAVAVDTARPVARHRSAQQAPPGGAPGPISTSSGGTHLPVEVLLR